VSLPHAIAAVYPWVGRRLEVGGGTMHLLDEGEGPVMLAVHGNPTWSFYWRRLVDTFQDSHRVVVPDHIGCGLSDKPQDWSYRLEDHVDNLERVVEELDLRDILLVVHDWGGAIGMGVATRQPDRFKGFVVTNTAAFPSPAIPFSIAACKWPLYGPVAVRGFNGFARVATVRAVSQPLDPVAKAGLLHPYGSWADRIATLRFVQDIPMRRSHPSWDELERIGNGLATLRDKPMLLVWGEDDFCFTPAFREQWEARFPNARSLPLAGVGHYVMEDAPQILLPAIQGFVDQDVA